MASTLLAVVIGIGGLYYLLFRTSPREEQPPEAPTLMESPPPSRPPTMSRPNAPDPPNLERTPGQAQDERERLEDAVKAVQKAADFEVDQPEDKEELLRLWQDAMNKAKGTRLAKKATERVLALQQEIEGSGKAQAESFPGLEEVKAKGQELASQNRYGEAIQALKDFKDQHEGYHPWTADLNTLRDTITEQQKTFFGMRLEGLENLLQEGHFKEAREELEFLAAQGPAHLQPDTKSRLAKLAEQEKAFHVERERQALEARERHHNLLRESFSRLEKLVRKRDIAAARSETQAMLKQPAFQPVKAELELAASDLEKVEKFLAMARANFPSLQGKQTAVAGFESTVLSVSGDVIEFESKGVKMKKTFNDLRERELFRLAWGGADEESAPQHLTTGLLWLYRRETVLAEQEFEQARSLGNDVGRYLDIIEVLGREMSSEEADEMFKEFQGLWGRKKWLAAGRIGRALEQQYSLSRTFQQNAETIRTARALYEAVGPDPLLHPAKIKLLESGYIDLTYDFETAAQMQDWAGDGPQPGFWVRDGLLTLIGVTGEPRVWLKAGLMDISRFEFDVEKGLQGSDNVSWEMGWTPGGTQGLFLRFGRPNIKSIMSRDGVQLAYNEELNFEDKKKYHLVTQRGGAETAVFVSSTELLRGEDPYALPGRTLLVSTSYHAHVDNFRVVAAFNPEWARFAAMQRDGVRKLNKAFMASYEAGEWVALLPGGKAEGWDYEPELWQVHEEAFCLQKNEASAEFPLPFDKFELRGNVQIAGGEVDAIRVYFRRNIAKFQSQAIEIVPYRNRARLRSNFMTKKEPVVPVPETGHIGSMETGKWYPFHIVAGQKEVAVSFGGQSIFRKDLPAASGRVGVGGKGGHIHFKDFEIKKLP